MTTDEIMALADAYGNATDHRDGNHGAARATLLTAIEALVRDGTQVKPICASNNSKARGTRASASKCNGRK